MGADDKLPMRQHAYNDPRAKDATELMVRMLRDQAAYEAPLIDDEQRLPAGGLGFSLFLFARRRAQSETCAERTAVSLLSVGL